MDGNGRWAQRRRLPRLKGHEAGMDNIRTVLESLHSFQVKYVTLYSFSTENWSRPREEVRGIFRLLEEKVERESVELHKKGVKMVHLGQLQGLSEGIRRAISRAVDLTRNNTGMTVNFAFNYGSRAEIVDAVRRIVTENIPSQKISEGLFSDYLYTAGIPDVDLLIRTGGELRLSNFLIWQSAYSELYFTDILWPDFDKAELEKALEAYGKRDRRFGGL
ncbi:MAG: di-trans,poly-cis-decaprenylcistransferase [Chloroflexi bacterium]|nr:di-trans,poly-cis-decaprenylcistransferase [Chloroflexota bacterium]